VRIGAGRVLAPTPPPGIDLEAWRASLKLIEGWQPSSVAVAHFGCYADVDDHLAALRAHLEEVERWAGELDEAGFAAMVRARAAERDGSEPPDDAAEEYRQALPPEQSFQGLVRYLAKRERR
jgi:hypothetical protein